MQWDLKPSKRSPRSHQRYFAQLLDELLASKEGFFMCVECTLKVNLCLLEPELSDVQVHLVRREMSIENDAEVSGS